MSEISVTSNATVSAVTLGPESNAKKVLPTRPDIYIECAPHDLVDEPYLLSTPSDIPYKISHDHKENWRLEGLFGPREEYLQYQTFIWRDSATSLFALQAPHELRSQYRENAVRAAGGIRSGAGTPLQIQAAKKKISLSDYKNKIKGAGQEGTSGNVDGQATTPELHVRLKDSTKKDSDFAGRLLEPPRHTFPEKPLDTPATSPFTPMKNQDEPLSSEVLNVEKLSPKRSPKDSEATQTLPPGGLSRKRSRGGEAHADIDGAIASGKSRQAKKQPQKLLSVEAPPGQATTSPPRQLDNIPTVVVSDISISSKKSAASPPHTIAAEATLPTPEWLPNIGGRATPVQLPSPTANLHRTSLSVNSAPDWIPWDSPPHDDGQLPARLPALPSWIEEAPRRLNGALPSPKKTLNVSKSEFSDKRPPTPQPSSKSSSDNAATPRPPAEGLPNKSHGPARRERDSRNNLAITDKESDQSSRTHKGKETDETSLQKTKLDSDTQPAKKAIKVTAGTSSFFGKPKHNNQNSSPCLVPTEATASRPQLIVRMKYGKRKKSDIQRILKMRPTPKQEPAAPSVTANPPSPSQSGDRTMQAHSDLKTQPQAKRPRPSDDINVAEPAVKRKKLDNNEAQPSPRTPNMAPAHSPTTVTPSNVLHRHVFTSKTEPKFTKAPAQASTPSGSLATPTPNTSSSAEYTGSASKGSTERGAGGHSLQAWKSEYEKNIELGRQLKHKMQALGKSQQGSNKGDKRVISREDAVDGLESALCFMQAFMALGQCDRNAKSQARNWESFLPLVKEVCGVCQSFKHLDGLSVFLYLACCSMLATLHPRLKPDEFGGEAEFLKKVMANLTKLQQLGSEVERLLPPSVFAKDYPAAYAECQSLPPGVLLKPMVAVRAGCKFLGEWTTKEKMNWKQRIDEGLCSAL